MASNAWWQVRRVCLIWLLHCITTVISQGTHVELCYGETLEASCSSGEEVIVVTTAVYGRMRLGRCVRRDHGSLGCSVSVLPTMHKLCSGRTTCKIPNLVAEFYNERPCEDSDLVPGFIELSYLCEKVISLKATDCPPGSSSTLPHPSGTLANFMVEETGCGTADHPWLIKMGPSQRVKLMLHDFFPLHGVGVAGSGCEQYGLIRESEGKTEERICRGRSNESTLIHSSIGKSLEITFIPPAEMGNRYFILTYEVSGCPEFSYPGDMWVRRGSDHVLIGCYGSRQSWRLDCVNDMWHGNYGNCTTPNLLNDQPHMAPPGDVEPNPVASDVTEEDGYKLFTNDIAVIAAVTGGVVLSLLLLAVGLLFDKSKERQMSPSPKHTIASHPNGQPILYNAHTLNKPPPLHSNGTFRSMTGFPSSPGMTGPLSGQSERDQLLNQEFDRPESVRTSGDYDVPHYYELDPDYNSPSNNEPLQSLDYISPSNNGLIHTSGRRGYHIHS